MNIRIFAVTFLVIFGVVFFLTQQNSINQFPTRKIGILQTASHPALDACKNEFIQTLDATYNAHFEYIIKNGEGSLINLHTAAQELQLNAEIELFYVIATPALQTFAPLEKERPILFSAVTDPRHILDAEQTNVTGISDAVDAEIISNNVLNLFPAIKTIGLIYNPSEINSTVLVKEFEQLFKKHNKAILHVSITSEAEVSQAILNALSRVDLLLAPTDNLVANTAPLIAQLAQESKKPFVVSDLKLISTGPVLAVGISYDICGQEAGRLAADILQSKIPLQDLPYRKTAMQKGLINLPVFKDLEVNCDEYIKKTYNFFPTHDTLVI